MIVDIAAGHISMKYGLRGPNYVTVSACASSNNAIIDSLMLIQLGKSDLIVTGGSEAGVNITGIGGFNALKALSTRNDDPATASRPFDANRDGFVLGEGSGCLILEELEAARKRSAKIYAEVTGFGQSDDAYHITAPAEDGIGAKLAMTNALKDSQLDISDIEHINAHGTSTPLGDVVESMAIKDVFKNSADSISVSSTKSMTGHLLGAAGAIESIFSICSINNNIVPPTINLNSPDNEANLHLVANQSEERNIKSVMNNTFGFGGTNVSLIFSEYS